MTGKTKLPHVAFEITARCNLRCKHCYNIWKRPGERPTFDTSYGQAISTLRRLFRSADVGQITMTGGEPFLAERLAEVVLYCRMRGKTVSIISNGTAGNLDDYRTMFDLGVRLFELPLHATHPLPHDWMTGVAGSWERSVQSMEQILEIGGRVVAVIVVTRANFDKVGRTIEMLERIGVEHVMLNRFNVGGTGIAQRARLAPDRDQLYQAFHAANLAGQRAGVKVTSNVCTPYCVLHPREFPAIQFGSCSADPRRMPLTLDLEGNLRLCNHSPVSVGNIFQETVERMLSSSYVARWKCSVPDQCVGCGDFFRCRGGCRAASEQLGRGLSVDPIVPTPSGELAI